jgi:hypothetical protein
MDLLKNTGLILGLLLFLTGPIILGQDHEHDHEHDYEHSSAHHEHPKNEIGFGNYLSYLAGEQEFAYSMHIHYLRFFEESRFGAGMGYEQIFDEHGHRSLTIVGAFRPPCPLVLSLAPGILFGTEENPGSRFTLHAEAVYEFEIGHFHLGPALEFASTFDEYHLGVGLHVAFAF